MIGTLFFMMARKSLTVEQLQQVQTEGNTGNPENPFQ